jgi:hypothetical protein
LTQYQFAKNKIMATTMAGQSLGDALRLHDDKDELHPYGRTLLVTDTIEADGRFILCHLAAQTAAAAQQVVLRRRRGQPEHKESASSPGGGGGVLWIACGSGSTESSTVRSAIRRIGGSLAAGSLAEHVSVHSVPTMLLAEQGIVAGDDHGATEDSSSFPPPEPQPLSSMWERLLAMIYDWRRQQPQTTTGGSDNGSSYPVVIIDDLSTLAALLGEQQAYLLAYYARDLSLQLNFDLVLRSFGTDATSFHHPIAFFGAGGQGDGSSSVEDDAFYCWEAGLVELADQIVDVRPLASGYSREAQGRFFVTDNTSQRHQQPKKQRLYNYLLLDNDVRVFRKE